MKSGERVVRGAEMENITPHLQGEMGKRGTIVVSTRQASQKHCAHMCTLL